MKWPWSNRRNQRLAEAQEALDAAKRARAQSRQSLAESKLRLEETREQQSFVQEVVEEWRRMRRHNNFAQLILRTFGDPR